MVEVKFYDHADDRLLQFAVVIARTDGKWVFCRHKERDTYEIPGGHRERGEDILTAAERELREETGAVDFTIQPICAYSVKEKPGPMKTPMMRHSECSSSPISFPLRNCTAKLKAFWLRMSRSVIGPIP